MLAGDRVSFLDSIGRAYILLLQMTAIPYVAGTVDMLYRYWMLGQAPDGERVHRWSVLRDVLHWVD